MLFRSESNIESIMAKKKIILPRNIYSEYKKNVCIDNNKTNLIKKQTLLPPVRYNIPDLLPEEKIDLLANYLKKKSNYDKRCYNISNKLKKANTDKIINKTIYCKTDNDSKIHTNRLNTIYLTLDV